jgi:hypothetical protein
MDTKRNHVMTQNNLRVPVGSPPPAVTGLVSDGWRDFCRTHWLAIVFGVLAVVIRVVFWACTHRVWEDAYITMAAVRNVWLGYGLTFQKSQPHLFSFTSPLSVLIPLLPDRVGQGLLAMRLSSLAGAPVAVVYAHRLCRRMEVSKVAESFPLAFIALDHSQVLFGVSGMETQVATAILLMSAYYMYVRSWRAVGITCGLALLARPDFILWVVVVALVALASNGAFLRVAGYSALVYGPWLVFATAYYGNPVPHTIVAKSLYPYSNGLTSGWHVLVSQWWGVLAPFKNFWFTVRTPVPMALIALVAFLFLLFILVGSAAAGWGNHRLLPVVAYLGLFFVYRSVTGLSDYFMWYLPPVTAMASVVAALGIDRTRRAFPGFTELAACAMAAVFAITVPWMMPLDRTTQVAIDQGVRQAVGRYLNGVMGAHDSVALEPLGYIGWNAPNKIYYDYPGLSSDIATRALASMPPDQRGVGGLVNALHPTYAVMRPSELREFSARFPAQARRYQVVREFTAAAGLDLNFHGLSYLTTDSTFFVLKVRTGGIVKSP